MITRRLSRRAMLRGLSGAAISLPLLDAMCGSSARGQDKPPKRFVVFYQPNGSVPSNFWPKGGETSWELSPILEGLVNPTKGWNHRDDVLIVGNVNLESSKGGPGDAHQKGTGTCLTGIQLQMGNFAGDGGASAGWANGPSIDQKIAQAVGKDARFPSLELGVLVQGSDVKSRISYRDAGLPVPPETSPYAAYVRLFGDPNLSADAFAKKNMRRAAVLDLVSNQYKRLHGRLGSEDKIKLEAHMAAIQDIQSRLGDGDVKFEGNCADLRYSKSMIDPTLASNIEAVGKLQMDLLAMAFACDLTRVGSIMWTASTAEFVFNWVDPEIRSGHHILVHKGDSDFEAVAQNTEINRWYCEQFAYFIQKLKSIPEGDGTVFDNTVILWTNEQSRGNNHDRDDMPYVLAGSCGGYFKTGRYVRSTAARPHNQLLVSLANAMDVDIDSFGGKEFDKGPLPGLEG